MNKKISISVATLLLWLGVSIDIHGQDFEYSIPDVVADGMPGEIVVPVIVNDLAPEPRSVPGLSIAVQVSSPFLTPVEVGPAYGNPAFQAAEFTDNGWLFGMVQSHAGTGVLLVDQIYVEVTYEIAPNAPAGTTVPLTFGPVEGPWGVVDNELTDGSTWEQVVPLMNHGSVTIGREFMRGDANADGTIGLSDLIVMQNYMFLGGAPAACADTMDTNADGTLTLSDIILLAFYSFLQGVPPESPFPTCGYATHHDFGCVDYSICP